MIIPKDAIPVKTFRVKRHVSELVSYLARLGIYSMGAKNGINTA